MRTVEISYEYVKHTSHWISLFVLFMKVVSQVQTFYMGADVLKRTKTTYLEYAEVFFSRICFTLKVSCALDYRTSLQWGYYIKWLYIWIELVTS